MAGTMAFYNGMEPGITKLVSSLAGDEAARKGYAKAATAEHDIASARKANVEAKIKQQEYDDTDKNAMSFVMGNHGVNATDFNAYRRQKDGVMEPGGRTFSPEESTKFDAALRDYGAFRTGKFHDVSQGTTQMAQLPAVQGAVRSATEIAAGPNVTAEDKLRAFRGATNGSVSLDKPKAPDKIQIAQWYATATPEQRRAYDATEAAGRSPAANINNFPGGMDTVMINGVPTRVQVGKDNKIVPIGEAVPTGDPVKQLIAERIRQSQGGGAKPAPAVQSAQPAPAAQKRPMPPPDMVRKMREGQIISDGPVRYRKVGNELVEVK